MDLSGLSIWALVTLPYYRVVTWKDSTSELSKRGIPKAISYVLYIMVFPVAKFSRTEDDYAILTVPPDFGDCLWSLGTFCGMAGVLVFVILVIFLAKYIWISFFIIMLFPLLKVLSLPFTKRKL